MMLSAPALRAIADRLADLALGLFLAAALLTAAPLAGPALTAVHDALTANPTSTCAMVFNPDACLDTSTIRDLRPAN